MVDKRIVKLEQELKSLKASQLLGSSSARVIPVANVNVTFTFMMLAWVSFRYTNEKVVNPIITPKITVKIDGEVVTQGSSNWCGMTYDDYMVAINFKQATGTFILPNEYSTGFNLMMDSSDWGQNHTVEITGTIYGVAEGKVEHCVLG